MDSTTRKQPSQRRQRAMRVIVVALVVIVAASVAYLYPTLAQKAKTASVTATPPSHARLGDIISFDFVNPSLGWALEMSAALQSGPGQFWVFRTVDGAQHWQQQLVGQSTFRGTLSFHFFDDSNGFLEIGVPSILYRTVDGGLHWDVLGLPNSRVSSLAFSDPRNGWFLALSNPSPTTQELNLYATSTGGTTWQLLTNPPRDLWDLSFRSPFEGWGTGLGLKVYTSIDSGRSWQPHDLPRAAAGPTSEVVGAIRLLPGAGVAGIVSAGGGPDYGLTSFDGGASWTRVAPRPDGLAFMEVVGFADSLTWWAIDGATLYKSADAGHTWRQVVDHLQITEPDVMQVLDSKHAWVQAAFPDGTGLASTADSGLHWTRRIVPQPP